MSIDSAIWERIRLEKQGYRSRKHLSRHASSWFLSPDVLAINKARKLVVIRENSDQKSSLYYKLTPKGLSELKKLGKSFRYHTRGEKITEKVKKIRSDALISRFKKHSFDDLTIERYELECKGWIPARTFDGRTPKLLIKSGIVEKHFFPKIEKNMSYYRLTAKGKKILQAIKLKEELLKYPNEILELKIQQAAQQKELFEKHKSELEDFKNHHNAKLKDCGTRHVKSLSSNMNINDVTMWSEMTQLVKLPGSQNTTRRSLPVSKVNKLLNFRKNFKLPKHV